MEIWGGALNSELEMKVTCGCQTMKGLVWLGQGAGSMEWCSPFARVCTSGVKSIWQHLCINQKRYLKIDNHANERNKNRWQGE